MFDKIKIERKQKNESIRINNNLKKYAKKNNRLKEVTLT